MTFRAKKGHFFVKSRFLATQEELEALLWICFTSWMTLLIFEEKIFFRFFFVEKKLDEKKYLNFLINDQLENVYQKIEIFFHPIFFDEKFFDFFFLQKSKVSSMM